MKININITKREKEILTLLSENKNNPQLAKTLGIADTTLKAHLNKIYSKLGLDDVSNYLKRHRACEWFNINKDGLNE